MRNLIAAFLAWFLPPHGTHRAESVRTQPVRAVSRSLPLLRAPRPADVIEADGLPVVRPYVLHHEREQMRKQQRAGRAASLRAAAGCYFPETEYAA
ncbi:hypothetical protein GCM10009549_28090 [Streptomyces thermoalcalitolerans]|uniref:Secreted protein n=1 Tax=Streptomyces thermoalcalitolerans TaxID=65605 RepID=A0ABN1NP97_9ACTN